MSARGAITHQDSMGNKGRTEAGDVQVMSAGTGVRHAEYNLEAEPTTLFQIWIEPTRTGGSPSWGAKPFPKGDAQRQVRDAGQRALPRMTTRCRSAPMRACWRATVEGGRDARRTRVGEGRHAYLVPATGAIEIDGERFDARDGAALSGGQTVTITALEDAEIVLVDAE